MLINYYEEALKLIDGGTSQAENFGTIYYYDMNHALANTQDLRIINTYGIRTFFGLQQKNEIKYEVDWADRMFQAEMKVTSNETFKAISAFHHVILQKAERKS